jgi:hypothetical protein
VPVPSRITQRPRLPSSCVETRRAVKRMYWPSRDQTGSPSKVGAVSQSHEARPVRIHEIEVSLPGPG